MRINAALALGVPEHRALYGQHFAAVWTALLAGLDNSEHMADFNEYKHRDALLDQVKDFPWVNDGKHTPFASTNTFASVSFFSDMLLSLSYCLLSNNRGLDGTS